MTLPSDVVLRTVSVDITFLVRQALAAGDPVDPPEPVLVMRTADVS